jgi:hypothetical protein
VRNINKSVERGGGSLVHPLYIYIIYIQYTVLYIICANFCTKTTLGHYKQGILSVLYCTVHTVYNYRTSEF